MRWLVMVAVLAACDGTGAAPDAAQSDSGSGSNPNLTPCGIGVPFDAIDAYDVVSDNTDLFVSVQARDGTTQVITMPIMGGQATTIATSTFKFDLAVSGAAVFYPLRVGANWELHQRVAGVDTVLGTIPAHGTIELEANATDLYVLGPDEGLMTTLWRLPRAGFSGPTPTVVSVAGPVTGLQVGTTIATLGALSVAIPGPSTTTPIMTYGFGFSFAADRGYAFGVAQMSQHTVLGFIEQVIPANGRVWTATSYDGQPPLPRGITTDDKHIYLVDAQGLTLLNGYRVSSCASFVSYDATRLLGLWRGSQWFVTVVPKPF